MRPTRVIAAVAAVLALGSCQAYEVDPVKPAAAKVQDNTQVVAQQLSPNVMIVVDRSGSMSDSPDGTQQSICPAAGQQNIGCKWDELLTAMTGGNGTNGFISDLFTKAGASDPVRLGLITFGGYAGGNTIQDSCSAGVLQYPITAADSNFVQKLDDKLLSIQPNGGTPTAATLQVAQQALQAAQSADANSGATRKSYVVLLTDGAPNCNQNFQATLANCDPSGPRCVSQTACYGQQNSPWGCLDEDDTVAQVNALAQSGISTFVIGFGADFTNTSSPNNETLEKMAIAGNTRRVDGNGQPTEPAFYIATDQASLTDALNNIVASISNHCVYNLDSTPPSPSAVEVVITQNNQPSTLASNQYTVQGNQVTITDSNLCNELNGATQANPITISFKYLGQ